MFLPLLVAAGALRSSLVVYGLATTLILHFVTLLFRRGHGGPSVWNNVAFILLLSVVTGAAPWSAIALWAAAFMFVGALPSFDKAFCRSAQSCPALGCGKIVVSEPWRLLGPLESLDGLLLVGLSMAIDLTVKTRLIKSRLPLQAGDADASETRPPAISHGGRDGIDSVVRPDALANGAWS